MSRISKPYTFVNNTQTADGTQVNANFDAIFNDYNGNVTSDNFATNGFSDSTKLAKEVVTQAKTQGVAYTQDLFSSAVVVSGGVATKDGTTANILDVTAIVAYTLQSDGSYRRISNAATTFTTNVVSTTYYLDLNPDGSWWWGTAHTSQQNYLAIAQVTTDASANISAVTDERNMRYALGLDTWHAPTLQNGWYNNGGTSAVAGYKRDSSGFVHIKGEIIGGTVTSGTLIFQLPVGYRPSEYWEFPTNTWNGTALVASNLGVYPDGSVKTGTGVANNAVDLSAMIFPAEQ